MPGTGIAYAIDQSMIDKSLKQRILVKLVGGSFSRQI